MRPRAKSRPPGAGSSRNGIRTATRASTRWPACSASTGPSSRSAAPALPPPSTAPAADVGDVGEADTDRRARRPIHRKLKLTLEEAAAGCIKVLRGRVTAICAACAGAGHQVLGGHCTRCGGSGAFPKRSFFGWPAGLTECEACLGGGIARQVCAGCAGIRQGSAAQLPDQGAHSARHAQRRPAARGRGPRSRRIGRRPTSRSGSSCRRTPFFTLDDDGTLRCEVPVDGFAWIGEPHRSRCRR